MYLDFERVEASISAFFAFLATRLSWSITEPRTSLIPTSQHPLYTQFSPTGEVRRYNFTIKRGVVNLDGVDRPSLLINDRFPGPLIEANYGDTISVVVNNEIEDPKEGTALHWHGILQKGTPWFDGVPGVTQCPIAPGKSLEYTFKAEPYGTSCA